LTVSLRTPIKDLFNIAMKFGKTMIEGFQSEIVPHVMIHMKEFVLPLPFKDDDWNKERALKMAIQEMIKVGLTHDEIDGIAFASEAWIAKGIEKDKRMPRDRPDRQDAFIIYVIGAEGKRFVSYEVLTKNGVKRIGEPTNPWGEYHCWLDEKDGIKPYDSIGSIPIQAEMMYQSLKQETEQKGPIHASLHFAETIAKVVDRFKGGSNV
jgi:hypothetical protein